ncbi:MAG: hypothetical protein GWP91_17760 [Rhodobacterales bacterium]|nr:hypothetical protein [Rhodobacterales bacterium]
MNGHRASVILALLTACQPGKMPVEIDDCFAEAPLPGHVYVGQIGCSEMSIGGGERRNFDYWLANTHFRAIVRHPESALTLQGVGGGTLVDAAPWDLQDRLHEIAPIVAGGWLDVVDFDVEPDGIHIGGYVASLPDRPSEHVGEWREVRWQINPDEPWLTVEGADGFWIHAAGDYNIVDGQVWAGTVVYGHDSTEAIEDLGGAFRIMGTNRLMIGTRIDALTARATELQQIAGSSPGAKTLGLYKGEVRVGVLALESGRWKQWVDARIDGIRAEAGGRPASPIVSPGEPTPLGPTGFIEVHPAWTSKPRAFVVKWASVDGRNGQSILAPEGGLLSTGAGSFTVTASGGPALLTTEVDVVVPADTTVEVGLTVAQRFDPEDYLLAVTGWRSDRDRTFRGANIGVILGQEAHGVHWLALTPRDEISKAVQGILNAPTFPVKNGTLATGPEGDWHIWSWGWGSNTQRPGHGAVHTAGRSPVDSLATLQGSATSPRKTAVDLAWLQAVGTPWQVENRPDFIRLEAPLDGNILNWKPWFDWLDADINLIAHGPNTWVEVPDPDLYGDIDIIQGIRRGAACASSGPLLTFQLGDLVGGDVLYNTTAPFAINLAQVRLRGGADLDHVALIHAGGVIYTEWTPNGDDWSVESNVTQPQGWMIAAAWNDEGTQFATTSPIWIDPP